MGTMRSTPSCASLRPAALDQQPSDSPRERVAGRPFHPQDGVAKPLMIAAQRYNRVESQRRLPAKADIVLLPARPRGPRRRSACSRARRPARDISDRWRKTTDHRDDRKVPRRN